MNIAIDIGTCNTRIATDNKGLIIDEPTLITYDTFTNSIVAVGNSAYKTIGKTPQRLKSVFPMVDGVISTSNLMESMIRIFIENLVKKEFLCQKSLLLYPLELQKLKKEPLSTQLAVMVSEQFILLKLQRLLLWEQGLTLSLAKES